MKNLNDDLRKNLVINLWTNLMRSIVSVRSNLDNNPWSSIRSDLDSNLGDSLGNNLQDNLVGDLKNEKSK